MSYYNKNYYPTPREVINKMIEPYRDRLGSMTILDPSAGMGAICDALKWAGVKERNIYCCEIDEQMKATLTGKKYKVVHGDFLGYSGSHRFDLIVMNPPFDAGAHHLLKAWEVLRSGDIVCLLNAETIRNASTKERKMLMGIIETNGSVEFIGAAFDAADRKTGVEVAMVRLSKKTEGSTIDFGNMKASEQVGEIDLGSAETGAVERADYIATVTRNYEMAVKTTEELYLAMKQFNLFVTTFMGEYGTPKALSAFFETGRKYGYAEAHNEFINTLQKDAWNQVFSKTSVRGLMTEKVKEKFDKWRTEMGGMDLNRENIAFLFDALLQQRGAISDECVVEVFDYLTYYNPENRYTPETWKTNSAYMVCKKFILNYVVESGWSGGLNLCHRKAEKLDDIDRAMCMVTGQNFSDIVTISGSIRDWVKDKSKPQESEFFTWKVYQKGTGHFTFKDESLRARFNMGVIKIKGWDQYLPAEEKFAGKNRRDKK